MIAAENTAVSSDIQKATTVRVESGMIIIARVIRSAGDGRRMHVYHGTDISLFRSLNY